MKEQQRSTICRPTTSVPLPFLSSAVEKARGRPKTKPPDRNITRAVRFLLPKDDTKVGLELEHGNNVPISGSTSDHAAEGLTHTMADGNQETSRARWRKRSAVVTSFNKLRECITGLEVLVNNNTPQGATTTLSAYFSRHHDVAYISWESLQKVGWDFVVKTDPPPKPRISPWGPVLRPIGTVMLCVRRPSDDPRAPWTWLEFNVLNRSPSQDGLDHIVIGQAGCDAILGESFDFESFNSSVYAELQQEFGYDNLSSEAYAQYQVQTQRGAEVEMYQEQPWQLPMEYETQQPHNHGYQDQAGWNNGYGQLD